METENVYEDLKNQIDYGASIHPSVIMGTGNIIRAGAVICEGVEIGNNNYIGPGCIIGDYPEKIGFFGKFGRVLIGNGNRFTKQVTIDSGTEKVTIIENNTIFLKNAHVGHDAYIRSGVTLSCNVCIGGHTEVGERTNFGLGAVAHQRLIIPADCMVGMNSTITKKTVLQRGRKLVGSPARDIGENIQRGGNIGDANAYC